MKLTFEIKSITLTEARNTAEDILVAIKCSRRLDRLDVAEVCAYVLESRRKTGQAQPEDEDEA